jgi:DNA-binding MarR family transcriptional regulator
MIMGEAAKQDKRTQKAVRLLMDSLSSQGYIEANDSRYQLTDLGRDRLIQNYKDLNASSKLRAKVTAKAEATTEESITVINPNHDLDNKPADKVELLPYNKRRVAILSLVEKHNSGLIRYTNEDPLEFLKDLSDDSEFKMMLKVSSLEGLIKYKFLEIDRSSKTISLTDDGREFLFLAREYPRIVNTKIQASKTFRVIEYLLIKTGIPLDLKISHDSVPEFSDWLKPKNNKMSIIEGAADDLGSKANILVRRLYDLEVINQYIQRQTSRYITNVRLTKQGIMFGLYLLKMQTKRDELKRAGLDDEAEEA